MEFTILIFDDEKLVCDSIKRSLSDKETQILTAQDIDSTRKILRSEPIDLILLDYKLGAVDGISVLKEIKEYYPSILVIMLTAYGTIDLAVEAMKNGAFDFIQKEEDTIILKHIVSKALDNLRLKKEVEKLKSENRVDRKIPPIISFSNKMNKAMKLAEQYSAAESNVLLTGETGTGKNLIARHIHAQSPRFNNIFLAINCTAIPGDLMESELFGYEPGSFTGARQKGKSGLIEEAHNGTLVLDEIGDMDIRLQTKFLHFIENGEFYRIGGTRTRQVNVRFIATTNADLPKLVSEKKFRSDLFYRLNVAHIEIPPLRMRKEDIIPLAKIFIEEFNLRFKKSISKISDELEIFLLNNEWTGNVRELKNQIERCVLLTRGDTLEIDDTLLLNKAQIKSLTEIGNSTFTIQLDPQENTNLLNEAKIRLIERALELTNHNKTKAAQMLGIPRTSLNYYILQKAKSKPYE